MEQSFINRASSVMFTPNEGLATACLLRVFTQVSGGPWESHFPKTLIYTIQQLFLLSLVYQAFPLMTDDLRSAAVILLLATPVACYSLNEGMQNGQGLAMDLKPYLAIANKVAILICSIGFAYSCAYFTGGVIFTALLVVELKEWLPMMSTYTKAVTEKVITIADIIILACVGTKEMLGLAFVAKHLPLVVMQKVSNSDEETGHERMNVENCTDAVADCFDGKVPSCFGRDDELADLEDKLCRFGNGSTAILGAHGIGKTNLMYGLIQKRCDGTIREELKDCYFLMLDLSDVGATNGFAGKLNSTIKSLKKVLSSSPKKIILLADEFQLFLGMGSSIGKTSDLADMLKAPIASGQLVFIAATTTGEFEEMLLIDNAFISRFSKLRLDEHTKDQMIEVISKSCEKYRKKYNCTYSREAILEAYKLGMECKEKKVFQEVL